MIANFGSTGPIADFKQLSLQQLKSFLTDMDRKTTAKSSKQLPGYRPAAQTRASGPT
jgi:hypothetical protein